MRSRSVRLALCLACLAAAAVPASAQFGQNKITYETFDWQIYKAPHFDVHYYGIDDVLLGALVSELESAYLDLSRRLDHELKNRVPVLLYRTHGEFEQTNVILQEIPEAVGGFSEPFQNRLVIPIDDPPDKRYNLIKHELVHIFQFDIFFAGSLRRALRGGPPLWLSEGMASFMADDEDSFDQMVIRDAVVNNLVPSIRQLNVFSYLTYRYGHAVFDFIETTYGAQGLRNFLFEFRKVLLTPDPGKAFEDAFGLSVEQFDRRFARFLRQRYLPVLTDKRSPEDYGKEIGLSEPGRTTISPALSPSGELIAALATPGPFDLDVVILSAKDGKVIRNLTSGLTNEYRYVVSEATDGLRDLSWSPDGDRVAFFVVRENYRELHVHDVQSGRRVSRVKIKDISSVASPSFSPDGRYIAFSGNLNGTWDIFRYDTEAEGFENITQDEYYDGNPTWSADGKTILYNRRIGQFAKIFSVVVGAPERKVQLTGGAAADIMPMFSEDGKTVYFSSDRGLHGVFNLHRLDIATGNIERLTDLTGGAFSPTPMGPADDGSPQLAFGTFYGLTFRLFKMRVAGPEVERAIRVGREEPQTSPRAPSRRAEFRAANRARALAEAPPEKPPEAPGAPVREGAPPPPPPTPSVDAPDADLRPFRPPLDLGLDADRKEPYRTKWDVDVPDIGVGVTDGGQFLADVTVNFSDLLGDQRVGIRAFSVSSYSNLDLSYVNFKRRLDWGARILDYRDFYYYGNERIEQNQRYTQASVFAQYPLSRHTRLEGTLAYTDRSTNYPFQNENGFVEFQDFSERYPSVSLALVGDTLRFQSFGPFQGHAYRIEFGRQHISSDFEGQSGANNTLLLDLRGFQRVTERSQLAARFTAIMQSGNNGGIFSLGGINQLRGFEYREFFGTNVAWLNLEYRFPLLEALVFGFGGGVGPFRGFVFADIGTTWFEDQLHFVCEPPGPGGIVACDPTPVIGRATFDNQLGIYRQYDARNGDFLRDVHASAGLGFTVPVLGLPMTWAFSKEWDGQDLGKWHSSFFIVYNW